MNSLKLKEIFSIQAICYNLFIDGLLINKRKKKKKKESYENYQY